MFWFFKESPDDKYIRALSEADGEWKISKELHVTKVEFATKNETFVFICEDFFVWKNFYEIIHENKREISKKFFEKIHKIASEYIAYSQTQKVGGYILDDDLRKAISDTKKILGAESQIEVLHTQIENIRKKYR